MNENNSAEPTLNTEVEHLQHMQKIQLGPAIEQLGLIQHIQGREENQAQVALALIEQYGYCEEAIPIYKEGTVLCRSQHNRLGEALLTGTIMLIRQALHPGSELGSWMKLALLYRDAADQLGIGRTLLNEAIRVLHTSQPNLGEVRDILSAACGYLEKAQADTREITHVHQVLAKVEARLNAGISQPTKKCQTSFSLLQMQLKQLGPVKIHRTPVRSDREGNCPPRRVEQVRNLLQATSWILFALLEEGLEERPSSIVFTAHDGNATEVCGTSLGTSLLCAGQQLSDYDESGPFLVQFLELGFGQTQNSVDYYPIQRPTRDGFRPGVWPTTLSGLEQSALAYLDREYYTMLASRAIQVLNDQLIPVCRISWSPSIGLPLDLVITERNKPG